MKKIIVAIIGIVALLGVIALGSVYVASNTFGATILFPSGGGTGKGTATAGDVGKVLKVLDDSPFTYEFATDNTGGGGSGNDRWASTSALNGLRPAIGAAADLLIGGTATTTTEKLEVDGNFAVEGTGTSTISRGLEVGRQIGVPYLHATSTTATSTITHGLQALRFNGTATSTLAGIQLTNILSCGEALETDASGGIICGTDATAAGAADDFTWATTYNTLSAATTSSFWSRTRLFASSTEPLPNILDFFTFTKATGTAATTTSFGVSNLTSALIVTGASGNFFEYAGTSCTNQFPRSLDALGAATCATVGTADVAGLDISDDTNLAATWPVILTGDTLSFGGLSTSTAAVIGNIPYFSGVNTFANIATSSLTIGAPLTTSGTIGSLVGGTALTIDIDDIKAADLDLTDITLADFTNDADYVKWALASSSVWQVSNLFATASSTFANVVMANATSTHATTTSLYAGVASTSAFYGAGLRPCTSNNVLTWTGGQFGCEADDNTGGGANFGQALELRTATQLEATTTNAGIGLKLNYFIASSSTATSTIANGGLAIGSTTPFGSGILTVGTSSPIFHIDRHTGRVGFGGINSGPARFAFGAGTNVNVNPNINLLVQDASDARMGVGTSDDFIGLKSTGGTLGLFGFDYAGGVSLPINLQEFGGTGGKVAIASSTPWGLFSIHAPHQTHPYFTIGSSTATNLVVSGQGFLGLSTTSPFRKLSVVGDAIIEGTTAATSTVYIQSSAASKGGRIILEDVDGAGCTEITSLDGVLAAQVVTCP